MNKAFVREPDDTGELRCPVCGSLGVSVDRATWRRHVASELEQSLAETAFFCPFPRCEVAYFDMFDRRVTVAGLRQGVYPKDPQAPICGCFGFTTDDIEADLAEGGVRRVRELIEKSKGPDAQCTLLAASGRSCVAEVQRYFMQRRSGG